MLLQQCIAVVQENGAPVIADEPVHFGFGADNSFKSSESREMCLPDVCDQPEIRARDPAQEIDLSGVIGPHFDQGDLRFTCHPEQGKGNADMVVQISAGRDCPVFRREDRTCQFLCRGFSIGTGNSQYRDGKLHPVMTGKFLEGFENIINQDISVVGCVFRFVNNCMACAKVEGTRGEFVAVE